MQGFPGDRGWRSWFVAAVVMLALGACAAEIATASQTITLRDPSQDFPLGAWRDPARKHHPGFTRRSDLESVLRPHGLAPDFLGSDRLFPYRWRLFRGGAVSQWRHMEKLHVRFGAMAGAHSFGLLGAVEPSAWPHAGSIRPGPFAPAQPTLRVDLLETRLDARLPFRDHHGWIAFTGIRSTLPAFGDDALGESLVAPEIQDIGFRVVTEQVALFGSRSKEDLTRDAGINTRGFDDLGVDLHADGERAGIELRLGAKRNAPTVRVDQEFDSNHVRVIDLHGRRVVDAAARRSRTRLEFEGEFGTSTLQWSPGIALIQRRERLAFARDDVPQHRFPGPPSMSVGEDWLESALWLTVTRPIGDLHAIWAFARAGVHSGYEGTGLTSGVHYAGFHQGRWRWRLDAAAGHRHAFPGVEAMLTRTLPIDLGAATERRPETAWNGVIELSLRPGNPGDYTGIHLHASHSRLTRIWVPADRITYAATTGEGQASHVAANVTSPLVLGGTIRTGATYAWTAARLEGGAYGGASQPAGEVEHTGSLWLTWRQRSWLTWSTRWQSMSGLATTPVVGRIPIARADFTEILPVMGRLNSERLDTRHRFDVGVAIERRLRALDWTTRIELLNAADRQNPIAWRWNEDFTRRDVDGMLPRIINVELTFTLRPSES